MKRRSIKQQLNYALYSSLRIGSSRRTSKKVRSNTLAFIYSVRNFKAMKEFASSFAAFLKKKHPELKLVALITSDIVQEYVDQNLNKCSDLTLKEYKHRLHKLAAIINRVYKAHLDFSSVVFKRRGTGLVRDIAFDETDLNKLKEALYKSRSKARFIPELTNSIGTRIEEIISVKPEEVHLDERYVELNNCKNGRNRIVPIREKDVPLWENVLAYVENKNWKTLAGGIKLRSALVAIRKAKIKAGIQEKYRHVGNHGIRKKYARERLAEELEKGLTLEPAWIRVQSELGHGNSARPELFRAYIGKNFYTELSKEEREDG